MYVDSNIFAFVALDIDDRGENARKIIELAEEDKKILLHPDRRKIERISEINFIS